MSTCRYCMHSEAYQVRSEAGLLCWEGKKPFMRLYCYQHQASVLHDDTCPVFEREPGSDDDLEGE